MLSQDKDASIFCRFAGSIWDEVRQNKQGNTSKETAHSADERERARTPRTQIKHRRRDFISVYHH